MKLLREPLLHFLALGAGLFFVFGLVNEQGGRGSDRIVVSSGQIERLAQGWTRTWQRPPTSGELDGLIEDHVRDEIFYREAQAMGLDRDDTIVRRRLVQKLEFLADDLVGGIADPTDEQLQGYLDEHIDEFLVAPRLSFRQIYFSLDERGEDAYLAAEQLLSQIEAGGPELDTTSLGDPISLPPAFEQLSRGEISGMFGREFTGRLVRSPTGRWTGPVQSSHGLHLVRVDEKTAEKRPVLDEVRKAVEQQWRAARRSEAAEAFYRDLRRRYDVVVERR